ncbi:ATP-binding protein [Candidatus Woesearchaeota archaeon]|nr:ATP-binding protein [Candidatus Woesearchaeota archaeon]MBI4156838.1 ATP-binding protein [Candidatus Woesearchaeota archaeon]
MPKSLPSSEIDASPTKSFFIATLVRDIQLTDAVLDLIDNSIDGYIENKLKGRKNISVNFSKDQFVIEDDCGGIKKENIYDKVFRFGMLKEVKVKTIGVFGVGMKRAIFKMGKNILIESDDGHDYYSIRINEKWIIDEENWKLSFEKETKSKGKPMTRITITELYSGISKEFDTVHFENTLREKIKNTYSILITEKVTINVKNIPVEPYEFNFLSENKKFKPYHKKFNWGEVEVEIYAGFTPGDIWEVKTYGWYVFCNDRLIIRNDTTTKTGWGGSDGKIYHYAEDNKFLGLVFFRSDNPISLPWHTTKEDIQEDSPIYRKAQVEMRSVTNLFVEVIRLAGRTKDKETGDTIGRSLFKGITEIARKDIKEESKGIIPVVKGDIVYKDAPISKWTNISYSKEKELVKKVKKKLGDSSMSNRSVGEKTFDYYIEIEEITND